MENEKKTIENIVFNETEQSIIDFVRSNSEKEIFKAYKHGNISKTSNESLTIEDFKQMAERGYVTDMLVSKIEKFDEKTSYSIKDTIGKAKGILGYFRNRIKEDINLVREDNITKAIELKNDVKNVASKVASKTSELKNDVKEVVSKVADKKSTSYIGGIVSGILGTIGYNYVSSNWSNIVDKGAEIASNVADTVTQVGSEIYTAGGSVIQSIADTVTQVGSNIYNAGTEVIGAMGTGLTTGYQAAEGAAMTVYQGAEGIVGNISDVVTSGEATPYIVGAAIGVGATYIGTKIGERKCTRKAEAQATANKVDALTEQIKNLESKIDSMGKIDLPEAIASDYVTNNTERKAYQGRFNKNLLINGEDAESFSKKLASMYATGMDRKDIRKKIISEQNMSISMSTLNKYASMGTDTPKK